MLRRVILTATLVVIICPGYFYAPAAGASDIRSVPADLTVPKMTEEEPAAGRRVQQTLPAYKETDVYHAIYLPTDWKPGGRYPVIVEYAGNGPYQNKLGDRCTGRVEDCNMGYGISGGCGYIWICMPYISSDGTQNQLKWWGNADRTSQYCIDAVRMICEKYGGDPDAVILSGFSRGAIACNYIGLRDDEIAKLWCGFVCHSHYDGVRRWGYADDDREAAARRLKRLGDRPQWISHERSVDHTQKYLEEACPGGRFTFQPLPYQNHTDAWTLRDIPLRREVREFCRQACE